MVSHHRGRAGAIRQYVAEHPDCLSGAVADFLYEPRSDVCREMIRMARAGLLLSTLVDGRHRYTPGRPPRNKFGLTREEKSVRQARMARARQPMRDLIHTEQRPPVPAPRKAETVAEFLAHGGIIEILPTHWAEADSYPRPHFDIRRTVAA